MCFTGKCPYESSQSYNNIPGECTLGPSEKYPEDAICVLHDKMLEQSEKLKETPDENLALLVDEDWATDELKSEFYKRVTRLCFPQM